MGGQILEEHGKPLFHIGDVVTIGDVKDCAFGVNDSMEYAYGVDVSIVRVDWVGVRRTYRYKVEPICKGTEGLNIPGWNWDASCFQETIGKGSFEEINGSNADAVCDLLGI